MTKKNAGVRRMITSGAVVLAAGLGTAGVASAATAHTATTITVKAPPAPGDGPDGHYGMPHGPGHRLLTGATLTSAVAAATAAVPNSTVIHAESGPHGTYDVHLKKSDGTYVRVVENSNFVVTSTGPDFGPGPGDGPGAAGASGTPGDPARMTHGPDETLLTGTTLTSAVTSATAAVPNATVIRAETDAQGATYEVHLKKADGTFVTVKENASFVVTSTQAGWGMPPRGAVHGASPVGDAGSSH